MIAETWIIMNTTNGLSKELNPNQYTIGDLCKIYDFYINHPIFKLIIKY